MRLHELQPDHENKGKKRVGRGGKWRTYTGRGDKGQKSRAGSGKFQPLIRRLIKRFPKLRGYQFKPLSEKEVVNVGKLQYHFEDGDTVNPASLVEKDLVDRQQGKLPEVKILGDGEINKELTVEGCDFSESAKEKIQQAGGTIENSNS